MPARPATACMAWVAIPAGETPNALVAASSRQQRGNACARLALVVVRPECALVHRPAATWNSSRWIRHSPLLPRTTPTFSQCTPALLVSWPLPACPWACGACGVRVTRLSQQTMFQPNGSSWSKPAAMPASMNRCSRLLSWWSWALFWAGLRHWAVSAGHVPSPEFHRTRLSGGNVLFYYLTHGWPTEMVATTWQRACPRSQHAGPQDAQVVTCVCSAGLTPITNDLHVRHWQHSQSFALGYATPLPYPPPLLLKSAS